MKLKAIGGLLSEEIFEIFDKDAPMLESVDKTDLKSVDHLVVQVQLLLGVQRINKLY